MILRLSAAQRTQPELLEGLEVWLKLGLLSEQQVQQFCQDYLTCPVPEVRPADDFLPIPEALPAAPAPPVLRSAPAPNLLSRSLQAFMAEISVIWLLFLGVFLVVLSSGVLAASQWQNVSPVGQYGILLTYTLAFWGVSAWTSRQATLQLTTRMLSLATLLIIPVNFWMMDSLRLWQTPIGLMVCAIAALTLTVVARHLLRSPALPVWSSRFTRLNYLGLSWLHWGWAVPFVPLLATYLGVLGTTMSQSRRDRASTPEGFPESNALSSEDPENPPRPRPIPHPPLPLFLATLLLIGRALLAAQQPAEQLGLAVGLCGWWICWLVRNHRAATLWAGLGISLLVTGWGMSVASDPPWQALAVSGLGLWLLGDRLRRVGGTGTLTALLLIGLQAYCLIWRVIPSSVRSNIIATAIQIAGEQAMPEVLLGLAGLPYLWFVLFVGRWLRRPSTAVRLPAAAGLAKAADGLALIFGASLTLISLANPTVRSLNLAFSALTLAVVLWRRVPLRALIYLTQAVLLAAIASWIDLLWPELSRWGWVTVLLIEMAIEWSLSLGTTHRRWRQSAWHAGLVLAGLSYGLLFGHFVEPDSPMLVWLVTPLALTILSRLPRFSDRTLAAWLSVVALIGQLGLLHSLNSWLMAFAVATGLMLVNTATLRHWGAAALTVGFALGLEVLVLRRVVPEWLKHDNLLILLAANLWLLWGVRHWLTRRATGRQLYILAVEGWAIGLAVLTLVGLTFYSSAVYTLAYFFQPTRRLFVATGLTTGAIAYRLWQRPTNPGFYGLAWSLGTGLSLGVRLLGGGVEALAMAMLGAGLVSQLAGDYSVRQGRRSYYRSWHSIPLIYGLLGIFMAHDRFTAWTGLYTLAAAFIGVGVGRRSPALAPITLIALPLASVAFYELLTYQLLQVQGGVPGDGVVLLAGLAMLLAWGDRLLRRWLLPYLHITPGQLAILAHLHWVLGTGLALVAVGLSLSSKGTWLWLAVMAGLSAYALLMGHRRAPLQNGETPSVQPTSDLDQGALRLETRRESWTYAGIMEAIAALSYGLYRLIPDTAGLLTWAGAIAAAVAIGLYALPWARWGWPRQPWRVSALLLPTLTVALTGSTIGIQSLLLVAAYYAWLAKAEYQIRISYISVLLLAWALVRYLNENGWLNALWLSTIVGGGLLYVAQVDPALQLASAKEQRHWLRSLATALIGLTALYQAEIEVGATGFWVGTIVLALALALIFAGLILRVRAFLYVGTAIFILRVLRLLWLFINDYSLLLWAIGIVLGLIFIWIAATFEARRHQVNTLLQYWLNELDHWE